MIALLTPAIKASVLESYFNGKKIDDIASEHQIVKTKVRVILLRYGAIKVQKKAIEIKRRRPEKSRILTKK